MAHYYRAEEVKSHPFFLGVDWQQVYMQKYPPPLVPPRGEVNAADAFDIGSFDEEDTKGYKVRLARSKARHDVRLISIPGAIQTLNHSSNPLVYFLPQLTEKDQELYQNFPLVISERWQAEVSDTVFETINQEADKAEAKKKSKHRKFDLDEKGRLFVFDRRQTALLLVFLTRASPASDCQQPSRQTTKIGSCMNK